MWIYDFPFCCESGKMSQIHVFRGVSETHININKKNILALVLAIMMSPIHGLFSKGQNWIWRIASTEKVAAWKFKYCVKVFILIVSNYSWLVRTYSVRTRVWFTVFSNDILKKKLNWSAGAFSQGNQCWPTFRGRISHHQALNPGY